MPKTIKLEPHLGSEELEYRYRKAHDPVLRSHYQILWLISEGKSTSQVMEVTGYSRGWIQQLARRMTAPGGARRLGHGAKVDEGHVEQPGRYRDGQGPPFRPEPDLTHGEQGQGEHPDYRKSGAVHPRPPWSGFEQTSPPRGFYQCRHSGNSRGTALIARR